MANTVIAGEYINEPIAIFSKKVKICTGFFGKGIFLDKETVEAYELITDDHRKSASSGIVRGIVGGALLGPVGLIGGALSAKNKGIYQVAIQFKDGKRSLIEIDDKLYKLLIQTMF